MAALYRTLAQLLREAGCRFQRQGKSSHEIWFSPITNRTFTLPSNINNRPLAKCDPEAGGAAEIVLSRHSQLVGRDGGRNLRLTYRMCNGSAGLPRDRTIEGRLSRS